MAQARTRRTQAERTAATKQALIEAAIKLLHERGYAGTTLAVIAEAAGVSRGSILHQFGTRNDLMVAVVEHVYERELARYDEIFEDRKSAGRDLSEWPAIVWQVMSTPGGVAVLEILLGSRSDEDLRKLLVPMQRAINSTSSKRLQKRLNLPVEVLVPIGRLVVGAVRGLSITEFLVEDPSQTQAAVRLLGDLLRAANLTNVPPRG